MMVAVKKTLGEETSEVLENFVSEAKSLFSFEHINIVKIHAVCLRETLLAHTRSSPATPQGSLSLKGKKTLLKWLAEGIHARHLHVEPHRLMEGWYGPVCPHPPLPP